MREKVWYFNSVHIKHGKVLDAWGSDLFDECMTEAMMMDHLKFIFDNKGHSRQTQFCLFPDNYYKQAVRDNCFLVNREPARTLIRSFMRACKKSVTVSITRDDGIRTMVTMTKY